MDKRVLQGGSEQPPDAEPLDDNDLMPFGKHKGVMMVEVPSNYLLYILDQDWISDWPSVNAYIIFNQETLEQTASVGYDHVDPEQGAY